jgi:hypothetical protein
MGFLYRRRKKFIQDLTDDGRTRRRRRTVLVPSCSEIDIDEDFLRGLYVAVPGASWKFIHLVLTELCLWTWPLSFPSSKHYVCTVYVAVWIPRPGASRKFIDLVLNEFCLRTWPLSFLSSEHVMMLKDELYRT